MGSTLRQALGVGASEVIALVGAGGKTTTMYRLARELFSSGAGVVVTTTTKIFPPEPAHDLQVVIEDDLDLLLEAVACALAQGRIAVLARAVNAQAKLDGMPPEWVGEVAKLPGVAYVLVEADGAARKPFTAPREYEPVIPASTTLVVPVVGADAAGKPLSSEVAHRPERVAALTGLAEGEPIDARAIATVILHPLGNTKGAPPGARIVPVVNKADTPERLAAAREIAEELLRLGAERVVVAAVAGERPVVEVAQNKRAGASETCGSSLRTGVDRGGARQDEG